MHWKTTSKWLALDALPERRTMEPKTATPARFGAYLAARWAEDHRSGRYLLPELKERGYAGSLTHLQRLLGKWRRAEHAGFVQGLVKETKGCTAAARLPMAPSAAAAFCLKPRGLMTVEQVERLLAAETEFTELHSDARACDAISRVAAKPYPAQLDAWMDDADRSGLYGLRRFVLILRRDIDAVRNAISEVWSNGQTEGQINRLKTLKRAMYG